MNLLARKQAKQTCSDMHIYYDNITTAKHAIVRAFSKICLIVERYRLTRTIVLGY